MRVSLSLTLGILLAATAHAQQFDAASVKPNTSGVRNQSQTTDGRTFRATNVPARTLIRQAYGLLFEDYRLIGAPDWTNFERFDIVATLPEQAPRSQVSAMLRALLADRFKLIAHTEVRDAPTYTLVLARKDGRLGPRLHHAAEDCSASPPTQPSPGEDNPCALRIGKDISGRGQPMAQLAKTLLQFAGRSIEDRTGLAGGFDFDIQASEIGGDDNAPSIFTAIQEQLGLKLEPTKAPVEFVVVDSMERPTPN